MTQKDQATRLKEEGNALFTQKDYALASVKYSEAIVVDDTNAVLYANRAACRLAMRQYLDAGMDAKRATELDPLYPKAFARLASSQDALGEYGRSVDTWQRALDILPKENLTAGELKQREQYQAALKAAKAAYTAANVQETHGTYVGKAGNMPWDIASAMMPELRSQKILASSAWVIWGAYSDFMEGVTAIKSLKKVPTGNADSPYIMMGHTAAIALLTNGIMRDSRVFHIDDGNWIANYNNQVQFEATKHRAWNDGGPEFVIEKAQERLRQEGWDAVRPAISTTIRGWIMRGFVEGGLRGNYDVKVEFLSRAIEVLKWGQTAWKNVSTDKKGAMFQDTFVLGVRDMYLEALMEAYTDDPGLNSKFPLEDLYEEARAIVRDMNALPPHNEPMDPGFAYSFYVYPKGRALAMQGFYHAQMARLEKGDITTRLDHYNKASLAYLEAAKLYPDDDEQHTWFLNCGLNNMFSCGKPLRETLEIMEQIRLSIPKMQKIWAKSGMGSQGRDAALLITLQLEKDALEQISQGKFTLDDRMTPATAP